MDFLKDLLQGIIEMESYFSKANKKRNRGFLKDLLQGISEV